MKARHVMPFGAQPQDEGGTLFRLWAPAAAAVELVLEQGQGAHHHEHLLRMQASDDGWYSLYVAEAGGGDCYGFRIDGDIRVPDPVSRFNPVDVHGASQLIDATAFDWDEDWRGRPWNEAVIYELHVGTFTREGTYAAAEARLPHLAELGITAIELMPLAAFPGTRGWGYDGVLYFAPEASYGTPWELKHFIQAAHRAGIMVFLDVVYNHFGPEGNYLHVYAPQFFTDRHHTPWGKGMDFDGEHSNVVREFFIHNALFWLDEYRFDGLRLDAVHAIADDSPTHLLNELSMRVRQTLGHDRHIHLVLENADNLATRLGAAATPGLFEAQWNDDFHHAMHVLLTGEVDGYYAAFKHEPIRMLGRVLTEGFAYQGEAFSDWKGVPRGQPSKHLPPTAFINFLQNHDQIGNRAMGERLCALAAPDALEAAASVLLLSPMIPMVFMGDEFGAATPFLFFCDFHGELARAVTEGRRREFAGFARFTDWSAIARIPDPNAVRTFEMSKLDWDSVALPSHAAILAQYRHLIALRRQRIVPLLPRILPGEHRVDYPHAQAMEVRWQLDGGGTLRLQANLSMVPADMPVLDDAFHQCGPIEGDRLGPWAVRWSVVEESPGGRSNK
ncbi:malto-oligosyltrehalose trehalohydrolase [Uliginosibacterium sp. sgz301328]|uniref:malto-oligosyltrehalose trehalohydrolase n=1 Tax=Uliginosibacterium sp. sgz301328 TaxID=3243764 RepID=UPI00359D2E7F